MSRSFQIVENKIEEAEFFLEKLQFRNTDFMQFDFKTAYYYLSAFLSATRSITFCLHASLNDLENFESWYQEQQKKLKESDLAQFFLEARNLSQKVGYYPLGGGRMHPNENGVLEVELYFDYQNKEKLKYIPETDLLTACNSYFRQLLEIVVDCYRNFGKIIDPEKYYTIENMTEKGLTVEDFEEELGFERGWTEDEELTIEDRVSLLRAHAPKTGMNWIFIKHLGTDRFGTPVDEDSEE
ncbi:MAG: hypothetical protein EYC68_21560 [Chloroflexota bacterium]|nr:MAG: hypothetical protein EYC68_21560 [Chloroflexota bacterium]